jgi:hypothetical protein
VSQRKLACYNNMRERKALASWFFFPFLLLPRTNCPLLYLSP